MKITIDQLRNGLALETDLVLPGRPDDPEMRESTATGSRISKRRKNRRKGFESNWRPETSFYFRIQHSAPQRHHRRS